jgi:O-antigen/teichoic acid export membrane protein
MYRSEAMGMYGRLKGMFMIGRLEDLAIGRLEDWTKSLNLCEGRKVFPIPVFVARRSYFQDIVSVLGSNLTATASSLLTGIILTRVLGATGFGLYSSIIVIPMIVLGFTQLGIRGSTIYHLGNKQFPENDIYSSLFVLLTGTSSLSILICGIAYYFYGSLTVDPLITGLVMLTIPLLIGNVFAGGIFLGKEEIGRANIMTAGPVLFTLIFTILFVWVLKLSVLGAFLAIPVANLVMFSFVFRTIYLKHRHQISWSFSRSLLFSLIRLGLLNATAVFIMQLNYRMDILMLKKMSTLEEVGFYSLATQVAEQLWHLPYAVELIILSRSANTTNHHALHRTVASIFRISLLIGIAGSVIVFFIAPPLVPLVFGEEYLPSVTMIRTILPGIFVLIAFRILNSRITGMGKPQIAIWAFAPALVVNFALNLILIPKYGGIGAAWSTNVSYTLGSVIFIASYSRMTGMSLADIFTFRKCDFLFIREIRLRKPKPTS